MTWQQDYLARFYRDQPGWIDGTTQFHTLAASILGKGSKKILEIGAGPSNRTSRFLATLGEVHGIDPDSAVLKNDALATAQLISGDRYPFDDASFDVCISNWVCEHVAEPAAHLAEVWRVLAPGGAYVVRTPNRYHYVTLVSWMTPHWFHKLVANRLRNLGSDSDDPYPTVYAMNSARLMERLAREAGFATEMIELVEKEPSYGMAARAMFLAGTAYERVVNATELLADLRSTLFVVLRKANAVLGA